MKAKPKTRAKAQRKQKEVLLLNPTTCGIYKNGGARYKVDHATGRRTTEVDNELGEHVGQALAGHDPEGAFRVSVDEVFRRKILVPRYYDERWLGEFRDLVSAHELHTISLGDLQDSRIVLVREGHGSPSNDMRSGNIPYVKVSDVRSLRVNVNPTNLVSRVVAERFWGGPESGLKAWDLITPNRASANIGEFAVLLPGEEERVLTKEFFLLRVEAGAEVGWDWAYLLWALSLRAVRKQWQRLTLMQTNREDVGDRYREILLPVPKSPEWAAEVSRPFREYFGMIADSRKAFVDRVANSGFDFIASVRSAGAAAPEVTADGTETDVAEEGAVELPAQLELTE